MEPSLLRTSGVLPLVSVIMPARNGTSCLAEALESIRRQRYKNLELVLIDDCSNEAVCLEMEKYPFRTSLHRLERPSGVASARNSGIRRSEGKYIAFLDADDLWAEGHLLRHVAILEANPTAFGSRGHTSSFYLDSNRSPVTIASNFTPFHLGASLFRRQIFDRIGLFDESMALSSDADFYFRCQQGDVSFLEDSAISLHYRKSENTLSYCQEDPRKMLRGLAQALRARSSRERAA